MLSVNSLDILIVTNPGTINSVYIISNSARV